ncbi:insulin-like peptide INSL5 [Carlito syrichta]|uniref:Insulin-like peptide INSL5 n=1 Tax=Carlito syrichta TaxID=1868482 RepID=A0A1U7UJP7_CARSF|nr:insulin-like peptide INSL5 [Carlito syrichta]
MKGSVFALFLFSALFAISEVRSKESVKLCGLEYVRTVIYICASSRWRRDQEGVPQRQQAEKGNSLWLLNKHGVSEENTAQNHPTMGVSLEERLQGGQLKHSVMARQDLRTLCCTDGCSMTDLSALC